MKHTFTVTVQADASRDEVRTVLERLIRAGEEDAMNAPEDFADPERELAQLVQITVEP